MLLHTWPYPNKSFHCEEDDFATYYSERKSYRRFYIISSNVKTKLYTETFFLNDQFFGMSILKNFSFDFVT